MGTEILGAEDAEVGEAVRRMLAQRCRSRRTRRAIFSMESPTDWKPRSLRDPRSPDDYFTEESAWDFIAEQLEAGCAIGTIELLKPAGKIGYVLMLVGHAPVATIYVKLQLGADCVIGRSFHESYRPKLSVIDNTEDHS